MADDDSKIVIPVEVTGVDEANKKIESLSETVDRVTKKQAGNAGISQEEFQRRGQEFAEGGPVHIGGQKFEADKRDKGSKAAPNLEQEVFGETNKEVGRTAEAVRLFREALHALHPAFGEAGISIGEMTALVRASTGGVVALAAAIGGLLVTALEKAGDEANDAASKIGTFSPGGNSPKGGREEFSKLAETGREVNEFPTALANPYEQLLRINQNQPPGQQAPNSDLREILSNLTKGLQAERVDPAKGIETLTGLLSEIREKGFITGDSLKALENIAPRLSATLLQELNKQRPGATSFSDKDFLAATKSPSFGGQIALDKVKSDAEFPESISTAWHNVKVAADRLSEISNGGHVVAGALEGFASFLDGVGSAAKKIKEKAPEGAGDAAKSAVGNSVALATGPVGTSIKAITDVVSALRSKSNDGTTDQHERLNQAFEATVPRATGEEHGEHGTATAADRLREAFLSLHPAVDGAQKTLQDWSDKQKELGNVATDAAKKQAAINLKFEPEETKSNLAKDTISVQNADIHLAQAKINGLESQKNKELAGLAPEEAQERVNSAASRLRKAYEHRDELAGRKQPRYLKNLEEYRDSVDEINSAITGYKRAQIEQKYSYLEEPKADLAAQQAQTAIKSAELEKKDSSLKLAKDTSGAPVTHELAQLRYAQAANDFDKVKIELLGKILDALNKNDKKAEEDVKNINKNQQQETEKKTSQEEKTGATPAPTKEEKTSETPALAKEEETLKRQIDQKEPFEYGKPSDLNHDQTPLYRSNEPDSGLTPRPTNELPSTRPNYLGSESEQGLNGKNQGERFVGPNEQGLSGRRQQEHYVGPNEQGLTGKIQDRPQPNLDRQEPVPLPRARPLEANEQQQSAVQQQPQQVADISSMLRDLVTGITAAANKLKTEDNVVKGPLDSLGVRGDNDNQSKKEVAGLGDAAEEAKTALASLGDAVQGLSEKMQNIKTPNGGGDGGDEVSAAEGGYIRGPGTTTSDSIDAKLSDKEYVQPADVTEHYGVAFMDALREKKIPKFAFGGLVGGFSRGMASSAPSLGFAGGGLARTQAPSSAASEKEHWGTIDMRTDHGNFKVATERDTMRHLSSSAQRAKRYSTGPKPTWYGGGQ